MNSFDLMIEKYSKELIETGKKSIKSVMAEEKTDDKYIVSDVSDKTSISVLAEITESNVRNDDFNKELGSGTLKIQTFAADGVYPVVAANVKVYKQDNTEPYFEGYTDANGIIDNIILPAPVGIDTDLPPDTEPYYKYNIEISHPKFISKKYIDVPVFDNINSIQTVRLVPVEAGDDEESAVVESENENLMKRDET